MTESRTFPAPPPRPVQGRTILFAQAVRLIIRLGSAAALARLLAPDDYGVFGMAAAVFGLLYMARDVGVITALQQANMTPQRFNALFRFGAIGGLGLAVVGILLAVPAGWFYGEPHRVPLVLAAMCSGFIFSGGSAAAVGWLYREQRAGLVALLEAGAMSAGSIAAVIAAWYGAGVWALVLLNVVQEFALWIMAWHACPLKPGRDLANVDWRKLALFGANLSGQNVATYCARMLDQVTVGRTAGATALGFYGRGAQIPALPVQFGLGPFNGWIIAALAAKHATPEPFRNFFRSALNGLLHISLLCAAVCVALPDRLLLILFGAAWLPAAPVVRWLGVALAVQPLLQAPVWLLSARGDVRRLLRWSAVGLLFMLVACAVAYRRGPNAIALASAAAAMLHAVISPAFCAGRTTISWRDWLAPLRMPLAVHGGFAALLLAVDQQLAASMGPATRFAVPAVIALGYYGTMLLVFPSFRRDLRDHVFLTR